MPPIVSSRIQYELLFRLICFEIFWEISLSHNCFTWYYLKVSKRNINGDSQINYKIFNGKRKLYACISNQGWEIFHFTEIFVVETVSNLTHVQSPWGAFKGNTSLLN